MPFHKDYSNLIAQLPPSIVNEAWTRLTARKRNPLTEDEASNINPIIESFLKHEIARYQQKKQRQRRDPNSIPKFLVNLSSDKEHHIIKTSINKANALVHSSADIIKQNSDPLESTLQDMQTLLDTKCPVSQNKYPSITYTEEEFNIRLKKENDALREKFIEASKQRILEISNAIARKNSIQGVETMKSWIRDGSIYVRICELEIDDRKDYSDQKNRGA